MRVQRRLRSLRNRVLARGAISALRAWRLAVLVSAVAACLRRRRVLRRWFAATTQRRGVRDVNAAQSYRAAASVGGAVQVESGLPIALESAWFHQPLN